ncbi:MAG: DNA primase [bacterium]|nr:DNA primase [bacterium]
MTPTEEIKSRIDVATLVSSYIKLDKAGVNFKARCPFHSEKTASFHVSPSRDIWHCFGCGKGGDIFKFVMEMDGLEFVEALRVLADRAGVELKREDSGVRSLRLKLLSIMDEATDFFENNLKNNEPAKKYLGERGLKVETIKEFRLGFAPDSWRVLGDHLKRKGYSDVEIEKAGLAIQGNKGPYDRFRSRIMFPLEDGTGRVIGFTGRIFGEESEGAAKYINSPQTMLYDKSNFLYGYGKSKGEIRQAKCAVVVEGQMDMIMSYQAGVRNVVAVSGTALTDTHLKSLKRLCEDLVFSFDVDDAGIDASRRAVGMAHAQDFHVRIADIEGGKDPADMVLNNVDGWKKTVEGAKESISFFLKKAVGDASPTDPRSKKKIGDEILPLVSRLGNEIERAHWVRELAKILKITEDALWRELSKYKSGAAPVMVEPVTEPVETRELTRKGRLEERIAGFLLVRPELASLGDLPIKADCSLVSTGELFERLNKGSKAAILEEFLRELPSDLKNEASRLAFEAEVFAESGSATEQEYMSMLHAWRELSLKEKLETLRGEIERLEVLGDKEKCKEHMKEFNQLATHLASVVTLHSQASDNETGS